MADSRREHEYDVAIAIIGYLGMSFSGEANGKELNPLRAKPFDSVKDPIIVQDHTETGMMMIGRALREHAELQRSVQGHKRG